MNFLDHIKPLKDELASELMDGIFRHRNVNGVGLSKDEFGWYIKVNLVKPHKWWHRKLPTAYKGARVRYQVIGIVRAC